MRYEIVLSPEAVSDFRSLRASDRKTIKEALEVHLRYEPTRTSKARIKRLRALSRPRFRLRVDDFRVFYDVLEGEVHVLAIVSKADVEDWLRRVGE